MIVVDPRITPLARTCDLFLPVKPGRDTALFNGILHLMIGHGWIDQTFIDAQTIGFDAVAAEVAGWTPRRTAEVTGIAEARIQQAAELWGTAKTSFLLHARGIEHHSHGVANVLSAINIVLASGRIGRPACGYATITGQANGQGGREHGQKCDQLPGGRDMANPDHRAQVASIWGMAADDLPQPGVDAYEIIRKIDRGEIKGLLSICFNPVVSLPDNNFVRQALEKLDFFVTIDFFLSETARYADVVLPGSLQEEDEGTVTQTEGRVIRINKAVEPPGRRPARLADHPGSSPVALGRERGFTFRIPARFSTNCGWPRRAASIDYSGHHLRADRGASTACSGRARPRCRTVSPRRGRKARSRLFEPGSWNPVAQRRGPFYFPDGKARFNRRRTPGRPRTSTTSIRSS